MLAFNCFTFPFDCLKSYPSKFTFEDFRHNALYFAYGLIILSLLKFFFRFLLISLRNSLISHEKLCPHWFFYPEEQLDFNIILCHTNFWEKPMGKNESVHIWSHRMSYSRSLFFSWVLTASFWERSWQNIVALDDNFIWRKLENDGCIFIVFYLVIAYQT